MALRRVKVFAISRKVHVITTVLAINQVFFNDAKVF